MRKRRPLDLHWVCRSRRAKRKGQRPCRSRRWQAGRGCWRASWQCRRSPGAGGGGRTPGWTASRRPWRLGTGQVEVGWQGRGRRQRRGGGTAATTSTEDAEAETRPRAPAGLYIRDASNRTQPRIGWVFAPAAHVTLASQIQAVWGTGAVLCRTGSRTCRRLSCLPGTRAGRAMSGACPAHIPHVRAPRLLTGVALAFRPEQLRSRLGRLTLWLVAFAAARNQPREHRLGRGHTNAPGAHTLRSSQHCSVPGPSPLGAHWTLAAQDAGCTRTHVVAGPRHGHTACRGFPCAVPCRS